MLLSSAQGLSAGNHIACMIENQKAFCYGFEDALGISEKQQFFRINNITAAKVFDFGDMRQVSCGLGHACLLSGDGIMKCIGNNHYGQLGLGLSASIIGDYSMHVGENLPAVNLGAGLKAKIIVTGIHHTCVLIEREERVKCFGRNQFGQLGNRDAENKGKVPEDTGDNINFIDLGIGTKVEALFSSSSANHNCVIFSAPVSAYQRMTCWGYNSHHQLGYSNANNDNFPFVDLGEESRVKKIFVGFRHSCAIRMDDNLKCWGRNKDGQIMKGQQDNIMTPLTVPYDSLKIFLSSYATYFLNQNSKKIECNGDCLDISNLNMQVKSCSNLLDFVASSSQVCVICSEDWLRCEGNKQIFQFELQKPLDIGGIIGIFFGIAIFVGCFGTICFFRKQIEENKREYVNDDS